MISQYFFVTCFLCFGYLCINSRSSEIQLNEAGQYDNILIGIDENVPQNDILLTRITDEFTQASKVLADATTTDQRKGLTFGTIDVLVPSSWSKPSGRYEKATWHIYDQADIRIERSSGTASNRPATRQLYGCGAPGWYTRYTDDYFVNSEETIKTYGNYSKTIVHQWAHYRWGVFDEYPTGNYPQYYVKDGKLIPSQCTANVRGWAYNEKTGKPCSINNKTNRPEDDCKFLPDSDTTTSTASLMSHSNIKSVVKFCNSSTDLDYQHNPDAPNQHNDICKGRSVWSVMQDHDDFNRPDITVTDYKMPTFRFFQSQKRNVVIVMETSANMKSNDKIIKLKEAATVYVNDVNRHTLGMVRFGAGATVLEKDWKDGKHTHFTEIQRLVADGSGTDIGDALVQGFILLGGDPDRPTKYSGNGYVILISNSEEKRTPVSHFSFSQAKEMLEKSTVVVDSISIGNDTDVRIQHLVETTRGRYLYVSPTASSTDLLQAMLDTLAGRVRKSERVFMIGNGTFTQSEQWINLTNIDSTTGRETAFIFKYPNVKVCSLIVQAPSGKQYDSSSASSIYELDANNNIITVRLPNDAEVGAWFARYTIKLNSKKVASNTMTYMVLTKERKDATSSISVDGGLTPDKVDKPNYQTRVKIYANVISQSRPVLGASVQLVIEPPSGQSIEITMFDNGAGYDSTADDGIYTTSLIGTDISPKGIYNTKAKVNFHQISANGVKETIVRFVTLGTLKVANQNIDLTDRFPPDRIRNVQVKIENKNKRHVRLDWIAVGNDGDRGKASGYEIMAQNAKGQNIVYENIGQLPRPRNPGQQETTIVQFGSVSDIFYLLVRATDSAGNTGEWSQAVAVTLETPVFGVPQIDVRPVKKEAELPKKDVELPKHYIDLPQKDVKQPKKDAVLLNKDTDLSKITTNRSKIDASLSKINGSPPQKSVHLPQNVVGLGKKDLGLGEKNAGVPAGPLTAIIMVILVSIDSIIVFI